jgi:hypothetical protein
LGIQELAQSGGFFIQAFIIIFLWSSFFVSLPLLLVLYVLNWVDWAVLSFLPFYYLLLHCCGASSSGAFAAHFSFDILFR